MQDPGESQAESSGHFWMGCAVWAHAGWRGSFYPAGSRSAPLRLYAQRLTAVEGNSFFYAIPPADQLERWKEETPEGFRFCPKVPSIISRNDLGATVADVRGFVDALAPLHGRLGPCFLQLPPALGPEKRAELEAFVDAWPHGEQRMTVELRHRQWYTRDGAELRESMLGERGIGRAVLDTRPVYGAGDDPQIDHPHRKPEIPAHYMDTGPEVVLRLICHPRQEATDPWFSDWAQRIHAYLDRGRDVYAFLHCPDEDRSPDYALQLQARLEARGAPVPPLPEPSGDPDGQLELF